MGDYFVRLFTSCCGLSDQSPSPQRKNYQTHQNTRVDPEEARRNAAAAAEARMKSEDSRGVKESAEFRRLQERQRKIDKANEEYERKGGDAVLGAGLKWQMN